MKTNVNKLKAKIKRLEKEILKLNGRLYKKDKSCSVRYITRMLNYMKEHQLAKLTDFEHDCLIPKDFCVEGLLFLFKNKIIVKSKIGDVAYYSIKDDKEKMLFMQ